MVFQVTDSEGNIRSPIDALQKCFQCSMDDAIDAWFEIPRDLNFMQEVCKEIGWKVELE